MDDFIHLRAIDKVVINRICGQRTELECQRKPVVRIGKRCGVPQQRIALAGNQKRDGDICVVLSQFNRTATVVEHSALVLAQAVEAFGDIRRETIRYVVDAFPVYLSRFIGTWDGIAFAQQLLSTNAAVFQISALQ